MFVISSTINNKYISWIFEDCSFYLKVFSSEQTFHAYCTVLTKDCIGILSFVLCIYIPIILSYIFLSWLLFYRGYYLFASPRKAWHYLYYGNIRLIEGNAKCRHLKNGPVKGLCGRCLSVWGPETHTPPPPPLDTGRGGRGKSWTTEKVRGATVHIAGLKI